MREIEEKDIINILKVKKFSASVFNILLGIKCNILVNLYDSNTSLLRQDVLELEGENYSKWGDDDDYIFNYVLSYYGFTEEVPSQLYENIELEEVDVNDIIEPTNIEVPENLPDPFV